MKNSTIDRVPHPSRHQRGQPEEGEPIYVEAEVEAEFFLEAAAGCYRLVYEPIKEDL
jgi:hypothetical protein